jgi:hypothetical protein
MSPHFTALLIRLSAQRLSIRGMMFAASLDSDNPRRRCRRILTIESRVVAKASKIKREAIGDGHEPRHWRRHCDDVPQCYDWQDGRMARRRAGIFSGWRMRRLTGRW